MRHLFWTLAMAALPAWGGETAILLSGMSLHIDRHEDAGAMVRLFRGQGITELPKSAIAAFEADEPEPPSPAPPSATLAQTQGQVQAPAQPPKPAADPHALVKDAATRAGLPPAFVESVAKTESGFDPAAVSPKGALGVMQLMPATAKALGADPGDPAQNIDAGARLLRDLLLKYDGDVVKALAAYNAGEAAVDHYNGVPPYPETQHYVNTVVRDYLNSGGTNAGDTNKAGAKGAGQ